MVTRAVDETATILFSIEELALIGRACKTSELGLDVQEKTEQVGQGMFLCDLISLIGDNFINLAALCLYQAWGHDDEKIRSELQRLQLGDRVGGFAR